MGTKLEEALQFDAPTHTYTVAGEIYPSITQVLEAQGLVDYSHLGAADLEFYKQRGTAFHRACWYDDEGDLDISTVDSQIRPSLEAWRTLRQGFRFTVLESEVPHYDATYCYAGTPDRVVRFPDGEIGVIELKHGQLQPAVAIQLSAQALLVGGHKFSASADVKRYAWSPYDGLREFPALYYRRDLSIFLGALTVHRWKHENLTGF